ncbi:MAG: uroporphyrinogen-III C-methyltransferase [Gemmatimonadota bacterium]
MTAIVLAAHGSADGSACRMVRRLAGRIAARTGTPVVAAFHVGEPGFDTVLDRLDADRVVVVPLFTSAGHFAESVLPAGLRRNRRFGSLDLTITAPVGVAAGVFPAVERRLERLVRRYRLTATLARVIVVGHGTRRHAGSRAAAETLAAGIRTAGRFARVEAAFLDDDPSVEAVIQRPAGIDTIVVPFLVGGGNHVLTDLPGRLGLPAWVGDLRPRVGDLGGHKLLLDRPLGTYPEIESMIVKLAADSGMIPAPLGSVHLVGAGPGDPGLLTVRGLALLRRADVVVHDRLIGPAILRLVRPSAELIDLGKRPGRAPEIQAAINTVLVDRAREGLTVVRLKGGDPFVYGRGFEELKACRGAGVPCEVVPGITSAIAVPAAAGIPITARGVGASVGIVSGQGSEGEGLTTEVAAALSRLDTIVVLMSRKSLGVVIGALLAADRDPNTPAACIQSGTLPEQRVCHATLGTLVEAVDAAGLTAPLVTVIGDVAALGRLASGETQWIAEEAVTC